MGSNSPTEDLQFGVQDEAQNGLGDVDIDRVSDSKNDVESGLSSDVYSRSSSDFIELDDKVIIEEGEELLKECPSCYKPYGKFIANVKASDCLLFLFVVSWMPFIARFTFKTSYVNFVESAPSLRSTVGNKLVFFAGFFSGNMLIISDVIELVFKVVEYFKRGKTEKLKLSLEDSDGELTYETGETNDNLPGWKSKNNIIAENRPSSLRKWLCCTTFVEKFLHVLYNIRWLVSGYLFIITFVATSLISMFSAQSVNDSNFYLHLMHLINGLSIPLYFILGIKMVGMLFVVDAQNTLFKMNKKYNDPIRMTRTGKTVISYPVFAFLTDKCPCNYAVKKGSSFPKNYRYSLRYHAMVTCGYKLVYLGIIMSHAMYIIGITIFSLATKINLRTYR
ncbi:putative integral membrane protein [Theileria parva strain Muguga]|uniref:Uncharacterized protein n=1 Tax=Theileria parva TaxID=5875 RepID=Q4N5U7_THEPA|nr:putative integral membrane protein [Theileria parva strain Muguga]EAN32476.1 putative integral membrane protein [Theileria parva strain Muguga]|eukprot:XP_764759.1 hypothetical protein [Theileria parva strain Muguga]